MAAPHSSDVTPTPKNHRGAAGARAGITAPFRWTLWVLSSAVAAGTIVALAHIGAGGAETQLPPTVQVGSQAATSTVTTIPVTSPTAPTSTQPTTSTTSAPTTTTTIGRTLVIRPQPTITSGDDNHGDAPDAGSGTTVTSQPTTSTDN
ncbi:MAG TPA: hypothetical protein VMV53_11040 [Acidimicrobiales bacterium]|nr:hypothetical protein [Acidimicrobiales bacterium]